jgi:hypothetical protein
MNIIAENPNTCQRRTAVRQPQFVILQEIEWPSTGGVDMDALPTKPVSVPLSRIRELRPAKTWKAWDNTVEIITASDHRIAVRGTLDDIVNRLNKIPDTRKPFALTPREERLHRMREQGYSLSQRALSFGTTAFKIAKEEVVTAKKIEAAAKLKLPPTDEFMGALHSSAGRDTATMMRDPNIHPDATT